MLILPPGVLSPIVSGTMLRPRLMVVGCGADRYQSMGMAGFLRVGAAVVVTLLTGSPGLLQPDIGRRQNRQSATPVMYLLVFAMMMLVFTKWTEYPIRAGGTYSSRLDQ